MCTTHEDMLWAVSFIGYRVANDDAQYQLTIKIEFVPVLLSLWFFLLCHQDAPLIPRWTFHPQQFSFFFWQADLAGGRAPLSRQGRLCSFRDRPVHRLLPGCATLHAGGPGWGRG